MPSIVGGVNVDGSRIFWDGGAPTPKVSIFLHENERIGTLRRGLAPIGSANG